jgi:DNA-binding PadR family transcriptional regulator
VSTTRLLILGAVRIFQPVHGYVLRRELTSWQVDRWAHLNPGSVYNALRSLTDDGLLKTDPADTSSTAARVRYRLTADGETAFQQLLREALWAVDPYASDTFLAALCFVWALTRDEVASAVEHRAVQIEALHRALAFSAREVLRDPAKPDHVAELFRIADARLAGELTWTRAFARQLQAGAHQFAGESPAMNAATTKVIKIDYTSFVNLESESDDPGS